VVERQRDLGLDLINEGNGRSICDVRESIAFRFAASPGGSVAAPESGGITDFAERWKANTDQTVLTTPACTSEIRVKDASVVVRDIANLKGRPHRQRAFRRKASFMTAATPVSSAIFFGQSH